MKNLGLIFLTLPLIAECWPFSKYEYTSRKDCWDTEVFVECGGCEGTCERPALDPCPMRCKPARCECPSDRGYVRSIHGHCIKVSECPGPSIYSMDPDRVDIPAQQAFVKSENFQPLTGVPIGRAPAGLLGGVFNHMMGGMFPNQPKMHRVADIPKNGNNGDVASVGTASEPVRGVVGEIFNGVKPPTPKRYFPATSTKQLGSQSNQGVVSETIPGLLRQKRPAFPVHRYRYVN